MDKAIKENLDRVGIIIQARMSSSRFPEKMLSILGGVPLVEYMYKRCKLSGIPKIVVATSKDSTDDRLYDVCIQAGIPVMRGDLDNVLARFIQAGEMLKADYIIRVCGDTPFVDIEDIHKTLEYLIRERLDYCAYDRQSYLSCFYSEAVTLNALRRLLPLVVDKEDAEHVTKYILDNKNLFKVKLFKLESIPEFMKDCRLTIDYPQDTKKVEKVIGALKHKYDFTADDIIKAVKSECLNHI